MFSELAEWINTQRGLGIKVAVNEIVSAKRGIRAPGCVYKGGSSTERVILAPSDDSMF